MYARRQIAFGAAVHYDSRVPERSKTILCDGCGQVATAQHIAQRLKRLENMSRYRPIHVQALFLGAASPVNAGEYLYSAQDSFSGEGADLLRGLGIEVTGRAVEGTLAEFQRRGYLLAHVLDCGESGATGADRRKALARRIPATLTRIRRSFKPKRVVLIGEELAGFVPQFTAANLDAALILKDGRPFESGEISSGILVKELTTSLQSL